MHLNKIIITDVKIVNVSSQYVYKLMDDQTWNSHPGRFGVCDYISETMHISILDSKKKKKKITEKLQRMILIPSTKEHRYYTFTKTI